MLFALLICSDEHCAAEIEAYVDHPTEIEALSCDCGCTLVAVAWAEAETAQVSPARASVELLRAA